MKTAKKSAPSNDVVNKKLTYAVNFLLNIIEHCPTCHEAIDDLGEALGNRPLAKRIIDQWYSLPSDEQIRLSQPEAGDKSLREWLTPIITEVCMSPEPAAEPKTLDELLRLVSKLPWHEGIGNGHGSIFTDHGRIALETGGTTLYPVATFSTSYKEAEDDANRRYAVHACNVLPALIKACRDVLNHPHIQAYLPYDPTDEVFVAFAKALKKAINL
jgi:hypothetical protein